MENQEKPNIAMRIGVIIGIIIILFIVSIGIIKLVPRALSSLANVSTSFSSLFGQKEEIAVSISPSTVTSGNKAAISYVHTGKTKDGFYSLNYDCQTGSKLSYTSGSSTLVTIPCSQPYPFSSPSNEISLIASLPAGSTAMSLPITIMFTPTGAATSSASGSATLNITAPASGVTTTITNPPAVTTTTPPPATTTYVPPATTTTVPPATAPAFNPNAHADLAVRIVDEGIADPATGNFISTRNFTSNNTVIIKFEVTNLGNKNSGLWGFQTTQPMTNSADSVKSASGLHNLAPGQSTGPITLALTGIIPTGGNVIISANPSAAASEIQTGNNTIQVTIPSSTGYNGGGYTNGTSDLSVQIKDVGILSGYNGQYVTTNSVRTTDQVRIHFIVKNLGGVATGSWTLNANLPINTTYSNNSYNNSINNGALQASLAPGATADFYLTFTGIQNTGTQNVSLTANPVGGYVDANTSNNTATTYLNVTN